MRKNKTKDAEKQLYNELRLEPIEDIGNLDAFIVADKENDQVGCSYNSMKNKIVYSFKLT